MQTRSALSSPSTLGIFALSLAVVSACGDSEESRTESAGNGPSSGPGLTTSASSTGSSSSTTDGGEEVTSSSTGFDSATTSTTSTTSTASTTSTSTTSGTETAGAQETGSTADPTGDPSGFCGDGTIDSGEACDDGNDIAGDGCEPDCTESDLGECGNGVVEPFEACDDGNDVSADGCELDCTETLVVYLESGWKHTCALFEHGEVRCWGENSVGQLGLGHTSAIGDDEHPAESPPIRLGGKVVQLAVADLHNCALLEGGDVRCWGAASEGKLGYGDLENIGDDEHPDEVPVVPIGGTVIQIEACARSTCALLEGGDVRCWGYAGSGALGGASEANIGDDEPASSGPLASLGGKAKELYAGGSNVCARLESDKLICWGTNHYGQTGHGTTQDIGDNETPASMGTVDVGGEFLEIFKAEQHTCALFAGGKMRCWGAGLEGRLGYGNTAHIGDNELPASAPFVDVGGTVVEADGGAHSCVVLGNGTVRCWGQNDSGALGQGHTNSPVVLPAMTPPVDVGGLGTVVQLALGNYHSCALTDLGEVRCWGRGWNGRLGHASTENIGDNELPSAAENVVVF